MLTGWPVDEGCLPELGSGDEDDPVLMAQRAGNKALAASVLWALSGRQFGIFDTVVRPCVQPLWSWPWSTPSYTSYGIWWDGAGYHTWPCGCVGGYCRRSGPGAVHLAGPAVDIIEVTIDGTVLDSDQYVLENNVLFRVGAETRWPPQDLTRPLGYPRTWSVEYLRGTPVPPGVDRLTGALAAEFFNACTGRKCRLPRSVISLTSDGITTQFNPNQIFDSGKTGLIEVDTWLAAINPGKLQQSPIVV